MASKKTIRFTDAAEEDMSAIRASLAAQMPLDAKISETAIVMHAIHVVGAQARIANANLPKFKGPKKAARK